jgi:amino acid adenylation domain-containing protein
MPSNEAVGANGACELPADVVRWNQTDRDYPLDRSVVAFFDDQVRTAPDRIAVRFEGAALTYAQLSRRANRLARELIARGVRADDFVGVCMHRSLELVVALVGVVKAGAAYVPFDPDYPRERLDYMFADSGARLVLTHKSVQGITFPAPMTPLDLEDPSLTKTGPEDDTPPPFRGRPDTAVYMIYTSGSTGKPKGVPNVHRGLTNRLLWMQEAYRLGPDDRVLQKTPFSFDVSVWEFFWPLMVGATICVARPGGHRDNAYLVNLIAAEGITTLHFVPSMLGLFLATDGLDQLTALRQVMCSGEALPYELTRRFFEKLPGKRLHNLYGPTEASIDVTAWECKPDAALNVVPIGHPIANTRTYILDEQLRPVPVGEVGELHLGGVQLARGYWNRPELTAERFVPDPFSSRPGDRLYKTGDLARYLPDGAIEYLGRIDFQVKLRGFRIELGEIEAELLRQPGVREAVVTATDGALEEKQLVAHLVASGVERPGPAKLREGLARALPEYMVPARFIFLEAMPLSPNGKVDRKALSKVVNERPELAEMFVAPHTALQRDLCSIWRDVLGLDRVGIRDSFFELGGNSLQVLKLIAELKARLRLDVPAVKVFQFPSVERLAGHLTGSAGDARLDDAFRRAISGRGHLGERRNSGAVAIVGMAGRFPGAANLEQLWTNLLDDVESISRFTPEELIQSGVDEETRNDPNYVPCRGIVDDADKFDAAFFGIGPLEAQVMDPQQRVFLELAWAALEDAGYDPARFPGMVGVYAGVGDNHYYHHNVLCHPEMVKTVGRLITGYGNEKDYVATRVSYQLDLTGPSVSANTGCSTSLLAVDNAVKSLNAFECDMALAGGVDIFVPQKSGQIHQAGGPFTSDGHCRPFDAEASGTMFCDGAGLVVLRRLEDAIAAGDHIYAVVLGSAKNNDGAGKVSFLAPSVEGQARVIALAQAQANVQADTISYVEAHGTGTPLGDPIEVEALTKAFRATTDRKQFCKLGSIKGHIGHPTIASGIASFIKVALALYHEVIPGTLHYRRPNPALDLQNSPFEIISQATPWPRGAAPRRGAISSFGFGGTNVHAILEEAPARPPSDPGRSQQLLPLSAKSPAALDRLRRQLAIHLGDHPDRCLADVAYTLQVGRKEFAYRDFVVAPGAEEAIPQLVANRPAPAALTTLGAGVVFLFPGQGAQYVHMGRELYRSEPEYRRWMDRCCDLFRPHLDRDLREILFPPPGQEALAGEALRDTGYTQPAMFATEYALARWWTSVGVKPAAVIGHSIGEYVGACLAGVFELEEAIPLLALRARLIRGLPRGTMLSVRCAARDLEGKLPPEVQLAAVNAPGLCVVAGPQEAVAAYARQLEQAGVGARPLHTSHAFHSAMMDPILDEFAAAARQLKPRAPSIPFLSTSLATWLTAEGALDGEYWTQHIRRPVLFGDAVARALAELEPGTVFLEVGPRDVLSTLTRMQAGPARQSRVISSLGDSGDPERDLAALTTAVGRLWSAGVAIDWQSYQGERKRCRVPLPTYPFERKRYWLEPVSVRLLTPAPTPRVAAAVTSQPEPAPSSEPAVAPAPRADAAGPAVKGLRLGFDGRGRPAWYAPAPGGEGKYAPLSAGSPPGSDPFAPPPRRLLPATPAQRFIWTTARAGEAAAAAFHRAFAVRLVGALDEEALDAAIQGLPVLHEALRGHFAADGAEFVLEPALQLPVVRQDLSRLSDEDRRAALAAAEASEAERPYDLVAGPLARVTVLTEGAGARTLLLGAHAAVCDEWSLDVMLQDLGRLYTSFAGLGSPSRLPAHGLEDYARHRAALESNGGLLQARSYWHQQFTPPPPRLALPFDHARPKERTFEAHASRIRVDGAAAEALRLFARRHGVSFFSVLLACYVAELRQQADAGDLVVGVSFAGHPHADMEDAIGHLVNVVPLRVRHADPEEFHELCRRCHAAILEAGSHSAVGVEELAGELGLEREAARAPLAAAFTYVREYRPGELQFGAAALEYHAIPRRGTLAELELTVVDAADHLELLLLGNESLMSAGWLDRLAQELGRRFTDSGTGGSADAPRPAAGLEAPRDALELYLAEVWQRTLGLPQLGVETSFYELGGHSLLAVQVFNELHQKFKLRLPLAALVEHETIRKLAAYLRTLGANLEEAPPAPVIPAWTSLVPLQPRGALPPLFCVAGVGGNTMNLRRLASELNKLGYPFYGLEHRGVDGSLKPHETVEEMASECLADIRRVQPRGPYFLAGYSMGGLVAYAMAQELLSGGEPVGGVVLIDTSTTPVTDLRWPLKDRVLSHLDNLRRVGPSYIWQRLAARRRHRTESERRERERQERAKAAASDPFTYRVDLVTEAGIAAERRYSPQPLDAPVLLIKAIQRVPPLSGIGYPPNESNGWRGLVAPGRLEIRKVNGSHLDLVNEFLSTETARQIADGLAAMRSDEKDGQHQAAAV